MPAISYSITADLNVTIGSEPPVPVTLNLLTTVTTNLNASGVATGSAGIVFTLESVQSASLSFFSNLLVLNIQDARNLSTTQTITIPFSTCNSCQLPHSSKLYKLSIAYTQPNTSANRASPLQSTTAYISIF